MPCKSRQKRQQRRPSQYDSDVRYMMRGMTDMGKMAVGGVVIGSTIGVLGSVLKK